VTTRRASIVCALLACVASGCIGAHEASRAAVRESFEPYRSAQIGGVDVETFLRARTATLISGPTTLSVETDDGRLSSRTKFVVEDASEIDSAAVGSAAAISGDGYFLTVAHAIAGGTTHVVLETQGGIRIAHARPVWSDREHDVALIHADVRPDGWFELAPERALAAGEVVLTFSHAMGAAAGKLEVPGDLLALGVYTAARIPHDMPLRCGHSGGAAMTLDGRLLGVQTSTGMDSIFRRRSWLVHAPKAALEERITADRGTR
jgi:S1-C subfamily serine protease